MKSTTNLRLSFISKKKLNINKLKALILFPFSSLTAFLQVSLVSVFGGSSLSLSLVSSDAKEPSKSSSAQRSLFLFDSSKVFIVSF